MFRSGPVSKEQSGCGDVMLFLMCSSVTEETVLDGNAGVRLMRWCFGVTGRRAITGQKSGDPTNGSKW